MKILSLLLTTLPLISTLFIFTFLSANALSQEHTRLGLPQGAKARLGKGRIHQVKYLPDGKRLAVATSIGVWIYDVETGEALDLLTEHTAPVKAIAFSPDGQTFATGSEDKTIQLWDTSTGEHKATCIGHEDNVKLIAFNPTGDILASVDDDESNRFWDVQTGKLLKTTIESSVTPTYTLAYSPDGALFITIGASDKKESYIEYWDAQTGDHKKDVLIDRNFNAAAISQDSKILAWFGDVDPLQFYDVETGKHLRCTEKRASRFNFNSMEFSSDGRTLITGRWNGVDIWDVSTAKLLKRMAYRDEVQSVTYSPDEKTIASGSEDGTVKFWDAATGKLIKTVTGHMFSEIYSAAYSPDGHTLACGSESKIYTWNAQTSELLKTTTEPYCEVYSIRYSPDGKLLFTTGTSRKARIWDVQTGRFLGSFRAHQYQFRHASDEVRISSVAFSPDGNMLATGGSDNQVCLLEIRAGELYLIGERLAEFSEHTENVSSVAFSLDGKVLASGSQDKTIQLWDINKRTHLKTLAGHGEGVTAVVYSPDGSTLASGSEDGTLRLWNAQTHNLLLPPIEDAGQVTSLAYSPDGNILASGSEENNAVHIWDAQTGQCLQTFTGHTQRVNAVVFSPDGKTLASVSSDGTILLWDLSTSVLNK